jgi:hypothetical protein
MEVVIGVGVGTGQDGSPADSKDDAVEGPGKAKEFLKRVHALTVPSWFSRWFLGFLGAAGVLKVVAWKFPQQFGRHGPIRILQYISLSFMACIA